MPVKSIYFKEDGMKKKNLGLAGGLLVLLAIYPLAVRAQMNDTASATGPDNSTAQSTPSSDDGGSMQGDGMDGGWVDKMKDKLKLSDDQVTQLKQAMANQKAAAMPLVDDMKTQTKTLAQKVKAGASDDTLKPILDQLDQDRQSLDAAHQKTMASIRVILTPTQQAKAYLAMTWKRMEIKKDIKKDMEKPEPNQ
jgi:Spy/CpxP family protein refolding chaperone